MNLDLWQMRRTMPTEQKHRAILSAVDRGRGARVHAIPKASASTRPNASSTCTSRQRRVRRGWDLPGTGERIQRDVFSSSIKIDDKSLASETSLFSFLKKEAENVRAASAVDFDRLLNDSIPDGDFDGTEAVDVATFLRRVSNAFGGAK
jgi:hypothetical protein